MEVNYKHRVVDALLERKLLGKGAVLVEGAKWCGKTTTSSRLAKSILKLGETSVLRSSKDESAVVYDGADGNRRLCL